VPSEPGAAPADTESLSSADLAGDSEWRVSHGALWTGSLTGHYEEVCVRADGASLVCMLTCGWEGGCGRLGGFHSQPPVCCAG